MPRGGSKPRQGGIKTVSVPEWSVLPSTLTTLSALAGDIKVGRYLDALTAKVRGAAAAAASETFDNVDAVALTSDGFPTSLEDFKTLLGAERDKVAEQQQRITQLTNELKPFLPRARQVRPLYEIVQEAATLDALEVVGAAIDGAVGAGAGAALGTALTPLQLVRAENAKRKSEPVDTQWRLKRAKEWREWMQTVANAKKESLDDIMAAYIELTLTDGESTMWNTVLKNEVLVEKLRACLPEPTIYNADTVLKAKCLANVSDGAWITLMKTLPAVSALCTSPALVFKHRRAVDQTLLTELKLSMLDDERNGVECAPSTAMEVGLASVPSICLPPNDAPIAFKWTGDGREFGGTNNFGHGLIPLNLNGVAPNSANSVWFTGMFAGDKIPGKDKPKDPEKHETLRRNLKNILDNLRELREREIIKVNSKDRKVLLSACFDLKTLYSLLKLEHGCMSDGNHSEFCAWCDVKNTAESKGSFTGHKDKKMTDHPNSLLHGIFEMDDIVFCILHAKMRVTENLLKRLLEVAQKRRTFETTIAAINDYTRFWAKVESGRTIKMGMVMGNRCDELLRKRDGVLPIVAILEAVYGTTDQTKNKRPFDMTKLTEGERKTLTNITKIWDSWSTINALWRQRVPSKEDIESVRSLAKTFAQGYVDTYTAQRVTKYIHIIACHAADMMGKHSLADMANQGFEGSNKLARQIFNGGTSHGGHVGRRNTLKRKNADGSTTTTKLETGGRVKTNAYKQILLAGWRILKFALPTVDKSTFCGPPLEKVEEVAEEAQEAQEDIDARVAAEVAAIDEADEEAGEVEAAVVAAASGAEFHASGRQRRTVRAVRSHAD